MSNPQTILVACFFLLAGCHQRAGSPPGHLVDTFRNNTPVSDLSRSAPTNMDTSMRSLRATHSIALADAFAQDWTLDDADRDHWNQVFMDSATNTQQLPGLALFPDQKFTENARDDIKMGAWQLDKSKNELVLRFEDGSQKIYALQEFSINRMKMGWDVGKDHIDLTFLADGWVHKRLEEDPYYPKNNQWRIKPTHSENDQQIRTRLKGYVHFYSLFFRDNHLRQSKNISFSSFPSCLIWYNGAIGMPQKIELDRKWIACFYSQQQAEDAYEILSAILNKHELKWPEHPTSWIKQTYEVLDQLYDKL